MSEQQRKARVHGGNAISAAVLFLLVVLGVGQVILYAQGKDASDQASASAQNSDKKATLALHVLAEQTRTLNANLATNRTTLAAVKHQGTCIALFSLYRAQVSQASNTALKPVTLPDGRQLDPLGGLQPPPLGSYDLSKCQDVLDPSNLTTGGTLP